MSTPIEYADTTKMSRSDWLEARRGGIGGSDAGAILGVSPWASPYSVWLDKMNRAEETPENDAMRFGNLMEPVIRQQFAFIEGLDVIEAPMIFQHPEHRFMLANVDGIVYDGDVVQGILEIKTSRHEWDEIPAHYYAQVQHYLAVMGLDKAWLAALFGGVDLRIFTIDRDQDYIDILIQAEADFWLRVVEDVAPDIDGSEATYNSIRKSYTVEPGTSVEDATFDLLIAKRAEAKADVAVADALVRQIEAEIMEMLGEAETGTVDGKVRVTWKEQSRSSIDTKALKDEYPEIAAKFEKTSTFRVLRTKEAK